MPAEVLTPSNLQSLPAGCDLKASTVPSSKVVTDFMYGWLRENRSKEEREKLAQQMIKAEQNGVRYNPEKLDKDGDLNLCEQCRGRPHIGSPGRHEREKREREEREFEAEKRQQLANQRWAEEQRRMREDREPP